ncbi:hypothetical protein KIW84_057460 [Lathyrus oleraceus]|uniref:Uncharacterized protein n=1 Tax=Pisum sativum TaxID=3888 RepID=A0A9D5AMX9_PEA|nr:hypothetical protein KIW84_057460 [Pisum sativum]
MTLTNDYEPVRDSLLHRNLLPTLENALLCLKYEETRLELVRQQVGHAFAIGSTLSELSCPYTYPKNGRAERKHRHILDSDRGMLISTSYLESTSGEATLTNIHIINRLPSFVLGNVSPFERL